MLPKIIENFTKTYEKFYKILWKNVTKINLFYKNVWIILQKLMENVMKILKIFSKGRKVPQKFWSKIIQSLSVSICLSNG